MAGLMIHNCYVLEFVVAPAPDMDVKRLYRRRPAPAAQGSNQTTKELLPCRFSQLSSNELFLAGLRGSEVSHRVYFTTNPRLRENNRLEFKGIQWILLGVPTNPSQADRLWQVDVKMMTQQNEQAEIIE